jgi:parallel beta-helix repeat protein
MSFHLPKVEKAAASHRLSHSCAALALAALVAAASLSPAATLCVNPHKNSGCYATIGAAVAAASPGDVIEVTRGTYKEQVTITESLSLVSLDPLHTVIDATGLSNGIFINGMSAAPNTGVSNVVVSGFKVQNANFEGILVANASDVTLAGNEVSDNNKALTAPGASASCPGINTAFETNEQMDCGEGIHLMGVVHSSLVGNESHDNSGGVLISDETGPTHDNVISGNFVHDNPYACGITMASHGPATNITPASSTSYGILHNTIAGNISAHNGLGVPGAGAGVGIFAPFPGTTSAQNVVIGNELRNNGLPGVAIHNHASAPSPAPPIDLDGNQIIANFFSGNSADTADAATSGPTGINIYSTAPVYGTIISLNVFEDEAIDVAYKAPAGQVNAHFNDFSIGIGVDNSGAAAVDATENWWHCAAGPGGNKGCATVAGTGPVADVPWLTFQLGAELAARHIEFTLADEAK